MMQPGVVGGKGFYRGERQNFRHFVRVLLADPAFQRRVGGACGLDQQKGFVCMLNRALPAVATAYIGYLNAGCELLRHNAAGKVICR